MIHYLWLNPVVLSMYEPQILEAAITSLGYELVICEEDHITHVKRQYANIVEQSNQCVIDMRCPAAVSYVQNKYPHEAVKYHDIEPILIHCAKELSKRYQHDTGYTLTIVTPCKELRELGTSKQLPNTRFITWLDFLEQHHIALNKKELDASPIPPGFFQEYGTDAQSLFSRNQLDKFFTAKAYETKKIAEMLYCSNGCHNGNGV